jgi:hypothetical protein
VLGTVTDIVNSASDILLSTGVIPLSKPRDYKDFSYSSPGDGTLMNKV